MVVKWSYLGIVPYGQTLMLMRQLRGQIAAGKHDEHILLLQHPTVITRGNSEKGPDSGLAIPRLELEQGGVQIVDTDRGGKTTLHSPGQLVGYFILDLKRRNLKIKDFVLDVVETLRRVLDSYDIEAHSDEALPGLFTDEGKIAFLGFNVKQHVTTHGFALNVNNDLSFFDHIVPCGMQDVNITSMKQVTGQRFSLFDVYWRFITYFSDMYGDELEEVFIEDFE